MGWLHWYHVPLGLVAAAFIALLLVEPRAPAGPADAGPALRYLMALYALVALGFVWWGWVMPFLESMRVPVHHSPQYDLAQARWRFWSPTLIVATFTAGALGFAVVAAARGQLGANTLIVVVLIVGVLVASCPVSAAVSRQYAEHYRAFIRQSQHCFACGYNLAGNPEVGRCPECGKPEPLESDD